MKLFEDFFNDNKLNSLDIAWIAVLASAFFILYLTPINFFYANLIILQLLLIFFVYNYNSSYFNTFSVTGIIILQIISLANNINVIHDQTIFSFILKTILLLTILFLSSKSSEGARNISNISLVILVIWLLFDQNSMSFNYQD